MLNIITAFKAEAAPIIEGLSLKPLPLSTSCSISSVPIFSAPVFFASGVRLGISGMGCANARILTDYFLRQDSPAYRHERAYWLNFGIAGSAGWKIGDLVLAQTVSEQSTGKIWSLGAGINQGINQDNNPNIKLNLPTAQLCSVQSPQASYQDNKVYDMEAAGIVSALADCNLLARTFLVKLISDGAARAVESLTKQDIQQLLDERKKEILSITEKIYSASLELEQQHDKPSA